MKVLLTATVQSHICQFHKPLVEMLHSKGCEVHVAAKDNLAEKNGLKLDFAEKVFDVPFSRSPKSVDNIKAYLRLRKIINNGQYDVIHCNTPMGGIVTRLAAQKARKNGTKVFYTAHGFHFYNGAPKKNWIVFYTIEKVFSRWTDGLITINNEDFRIAKKKFNCPVYYIHGVGVDNKRYYCAAESERIRAKKDLDLSSKKVLLCIGELLPNKNQMMAIRSMSYITRFYPDSVLLIAGNGREKDALEAEIKRRKLESNIKLLGYCTNLELYQKATDVVVACSIREGLGLNIIEALLSGNPVVATDNRGHRDLVINDENGFLVSQNDHVEMAKRVVELLSREDKEAIRLKAMKVALDFSAENVKKELEVIYRNVEKWKN